MVGRFKPTTSWCKNGAINAVRDTLFHPFYTSCSFHTAENIRTPEVFWCFQGVKKGTSSMIWVNFFLKTRLYSDLHIPIHCVKSVQIGSFFWSLFSRIWTKYRDLRSKSPYSFRILENADQKKTPYLDTFHTVICCMKTETFKLLPGISPLDTGPKLNIPKRFRRRIGYLMFVQTTFSAQRVQYRPIEPHFLIYFRLPKIYFLFNYFHSKFLYSNLIARSY